MKVFRDWPFFQGIILVPSLTWDKSSDTELGSSASREQGFFKFAKCMQYKCWIHIKLLDFINVNVNEYKFMKKKKHLATSFRTKKNDIHSISPLTNQCILKREMFMFFFAFQMSRLFSKTPKFHTSKTWKIPRSENFQNDFLNASCTYNNYIPIPFVRERESI